MDDQLAARQVVELLLVCGRHQPVGRLGGDGRRCLTVPGRFLRVGHEAVRRILYDYRSGMRGRMLEAINKAHTSENAMLIDCRTKDEFNHGHVAGAVNIPLDKITEDRILRRRGSEDYVSVTLTDEVDPYKPKEQLERKFHHILEVRMDNERTRQKLEFSEEQIRIGTPFETFCDFYKEMQGQEMSEQEQKILREILSEMKGEDV